MLSDSFTCIIVPTAAIALWWAKVRVSVSRFLMGLSSILVFVGLVAMTSGSPALAAASAAALAALAAALVLLRSVFIARALRNSTTVLPEKWE